MSSWQSELKRCILILSITGAIGLIFGELLLAWLITLSAFVLINLYQLRRLNQWLQEASSTDNIDAPESVGLWGDIFDSIYRIQKQERKTGIFLSQIINKAQESSAALEIAVIMINKQGNLDWWNLASQELLGLKYPQDRNQSVTNLIRDPEFAEYFHSENYEETLKLEAPGDSQKILEYQIALFGEHERLMIVRDITQIQRLENMRKDFVGNVSHELGTPITVFKGYLEAIIDNMDQLDPRWEKPMLQMKQQALRMENIVKDLLLLSSLETKTLPKQQDKIHLAQLISEIESDTQQMFLDKSHKFINDCDQTIVVTGKRSELYSALSNLVVNAAKYTPKNGTIRVSSELTNKSLNLLVEDNGIGIDAQHLPRLTERFYRVDVSRSSETGGTGLGLAIVKHILLRHDAVLEIDSEVGKGSKFICNIPLARISNVANEDSQSQPTLEASE